MSGNKQSGSDGSWFVWLILGLLVLAGVIYGVSAVGNFLGLTPSGSEVFDGKDGWVSKHYEGVAVGYVLTLAVIAFPVAAYVGWRWWQSNHPGEEHRFLIWFTGAAAVLVIAVVAVPAGVRDAELLDDGRGGAVLASSESADDEDASDRVQERRQARREQARLERRRERLRAARREAREEAAKREARQEARAVAAAAEEPAPVEEAPSVSGQSCDPNYSGACLDSGVSDYDCEGGEGDGPMYTGAVTVVGSDPHGLDSDGDGSACEPY